MSKKTVQLSNAEVDVKTSLTWGESEQIKSVMVGAMKIKGTTVDGINPEVILEGKYRLLELSVIEVREGGKIIPFTRDWMNQLTVEDGEKLYGEVDETTKKK